MFAYGGLGFDWSLGVSKLLDVGTGYLQAEAQKGVAASQAQLVAAQQGLVTAQTELAQAKAAQAGFGGIDIGKMAIPLAIGIGALIFMTMKKGTRRRR